MPAMLELLRTRVEPAWIDYNGHMNVAYYHMVFDRATDRFLERVGLGEASARAGIGSTFALEDHLVYRRELRLDDPLRVTLQLLDVDRKRLHYFLWMYHDGDGRVAATCEHLAVYVDFATRRAAPLPPKSLAAIEEIYEAHRRYPWPPEAGRPMGLRRRGEPRRGG